jgi:hypothetical protein
MSKDTHHGIICDANLRARTMSVVQAVEHLSSRCEALSSNPSITKKGYIPSSKERVEQIMICSYNIPLYYNYNSVLMNNKQQLNVFGKDQDSCVYRNITIFLC